MINGWEKETINDVALVGDGAHASIKRVDKGVLYLTSKNFDLNGLKLSKVDYISKEDYLKYFKEDSKALTKPRKGDILLSIIGSMGAAHLVNNDDDFGLSSSVSILRPNTNIIPAFLLYWIKGQYFQESIKGIKSGVAQSFLSLAMIRSLPCINPPLPTQQKIADILSAYDDLIENNTKRIELLEEQAQLIYEEWFVRMNFPNHKNTKIDAETGLPKGWKDTKIGEVFKTSSGGTPSKKKETEYYENGHIPWVRTGELKQFILIESELYITEKGLKESSAKMFPKNTVLLAMYGNTIGETTFAAKSVSTNQACCAFLVEDDKEYLSYFIHQYLLYNKEYILNFRMGAAQENISQSIIKNIEIRIPSTDIFLKFEELIKPLYLLIENLAKQNKYLKEARDILLPRLMMGIIEV